MCFSLRSWAEFHVTLVPYTVPRAAGLSLEEGSFNVTLAPLATLFIQTSSVYIAFFPWETVLQDGLRTQKSVAFILSFPCLFYIYSEPCSLITKQLDLIW